MTNNLRKESLSLIDRVSQFFKGKPKPTPEQEHLGLPTTDTDVFDFSKIKLFELSGDRFSRYRDYDEMDEDMVELSSALDIHADYVCASSSDVSETYNIKFDNSVGESIREKIADFEDDTELKEIVWLMTRNMCKYGDAFYEIVVSPRKIVKIKYHSPYNVFVNYDKSRNALDKEFPYILKDEANSREIYRFPSWQLVHFKLGDDIYGVEYSLFAKLRRTYRIERLLEDSLLVTRVARASQRGVWRIDVTGMGELQALKYIQKLKLLNSSKFSIDFTGKMKKDYNPLAAMEDIYLPVRKDGAQVDYSVVAGEANLGEIRDVEHFHNKIFSATKVPKAFLGFEGDVNSKATLVQQNIAFVRGIKRHRYALSRGLRKIYRIAMVLSGINPDSFYWSIQFPPIGSPDELAKWAVEVTKTQVLSGYMNLGIQLPPDWIIKNLFLDITPEEKEALLKAIEKYKKEQANQQQAQGMANPGGIPPAGEGGIPQQIPNPSPASLANTPNEVQWASDERTLDNIRRRVLENSHRVKLLEDVQRLIKEASSDNIS